MKRMLFIGKRHDSTGTVGSYDLADYDDPSRKVQNFSAEYIMNAILRKEMIVDKLRVENGNLVHFDPKSEQRAANAAAIREAEALAEMEREEKTSKPRARRKKKSSGKKRRRR